MSQYKFEDAMARLEEIVKILEGGNCPLDKSVSLYEEGLKLSKECTEQLNEAKQKIVSIDSFIKEQTSDEK